MNGINFSINSNESSINTKKNARLKPFAIHTVTFDGVEIKEGVSKAGNNYKLLQFSFSNDEGSADLTIFWPNPEKDGIRETRTAKDGHEYEVASRWEQTKAIITQTLETLNPEGYKKMQELSVKFKSFDDMATVFEKLVNKCKGTEVDVKFNGYVNKAGYTQLSFPTIVGVNKEGNCFISDNYIGFGTLGLSDYELRRGAELETTPTNMKKDSLMDAPIEGGNRGSEDEELDLSDL